MGVFLFIVGVIWALIGVGNIYSGLSNIAASGWSSNWASFNLIFNMVLFVLPGLVVAGLGYHISAKKQSARSSLKKCPNCAELIQKDARLCRFCGQKLPPPPSSKNPS